MITRTIDNEERLLLLIPGTNDWDDVKMDFDVRFHRFKLAATRVMRVLGRLFFGRGRRAATPPSQTDGTAFASSSQPTHPAAYWAENDLVPVDGLDFSAQNATRDPHDQGQVHRGFYRAYLSINVPMMAALRKPLETHDHLVIVGHSLGGAVALIAALHIQKTYPALHIDLITFGAPKVGNRVFTQFCEGKMLTHHRVVNGMDGVPDYPPLPAFQHLGEAFPIGARRGWLSGFRWIKGHWIRDDFIERYHDSLEGIMIRLFYRHRAAFPVPFCG